MDDGPGVPVDERAKMLQPLYQLETTRRGDGFGLSLSIGSAICALHGAQLTLSDGPRGKGSRWQSDLRTLQVCKALVRQRRRSDPI